MKNGINQEIFLSSTVFKNVRKMFGSRMRAVISGSAAFSESSHYFLQAVMGTIPIVQGFGLTEVFRMIIFCFQYFGNLTTFN